ncbi:MAG: DNA polymerase IV [Actinomycetota bacterium]|nr:DNA polymerase IV [Actinomycetota bacterium]
MTLATILHVDMDAFYASVETVKDPSLKGRPVVVGGGAGATGMGGGRGVVTSASYEARSFGVSAAMPLITARRLCPHGVFLPNDFGAYSDYSARIREVFTSITPLVEPLSLDEAFLDVAGAVKLFGPPAQIGRLIKERIAELGLSCSVGIATNKFLAKLASTQSKPAGLLQVGPDGVAEWLHPLPVTALWGVGGRTAETLHRLGLRTVEDVAAISRRTLERAVGDALGAHLHALALGRDDRAVIPSEPAKSVGSEETFEADLDCTEDVLRELLRLSDRTASRLRDKGLCGRTVTLKLRWSNFQTLTRSRTLEEEVDTAAEIYEVVGALFEKLAPDRFRIRLLGVSTAALSVGAPARQTSLFGDPSHRRRLASGAVDSLRGRFGPEAVRPATLLD